MELIKQNLFKKMSRNIQITKKSIANRKRLLFSKTKRIQIDGKINLLAAAKWFIYNTINTKKY